MKTKTWSFYNPETGIFTGRRLTCSDDVLQNNIPEGCVSLVGAFDHLSQRVDIATGAVVDYQPPQPDDDHEWNAETKRWQLKAEVVERNQRHADAQAQLETLDPKELRALSDLMAEPDSQTAKERFASVRAQKDEARKARAG